MSTWVKRSEREPTQGEAPLVYGCYEGQKWLESSAQNAWHAGMNTAYTHWRSIKADPPPRELTQREKDWKDAHAIAMASDGSVTEYILEGIYAERREVRELLTSWAKDPTWGKGWGTLELRGVRARLDEQGGGK